LAERWSLSGQSVRRKITAGKIPAIRAPGSTAIRIPTEFVRRYEAAFPHATITTAFTPTPITTP
jgi:hypothetical protein